MSSSLTAAETQGKPKELLNQVRDVMRFKHHGLCKPTPIPRARPRRVRDGFMKVKFCRDGRWEGSPILPTFC
jgi:hypothetical protein